MYEVAEFIEPYGMWIDRTFKTEKEARDYCNQRNKNGRLDYRWRKIPS